jgi:hypothetical protein
MLKVTFVCFYSAPRQLTSYGAETGKLILANLGDFKLKGTSGVKTTSPAGAKR